MRIRSITCFWNPKESNAEQSLNQLARLSEIAAARFAENGYEVQTTRLATVPFPEYLDRFEEDAAISLAQKIEALAKAHHFAYWCLGSARPEQPKSYSLIPSMLANTENAFFNGVIADAQNGVYLKAIWSCAQIIHQASRIAPDGFTNLRFTALANVPPFGPFFPAAYHHGISPAFGLALEAADLAIKAFSAASTLAEARQNLVDALDENGKALKRIADHLQAEFGVEFKGMDFSLAPFPEDWCSLGGAIERLGVEKMGLIGSLAAAAFVADALDRGNWQRAGFNGLMLPVLEDGVLARRTIDGTLTIKDMLLYSTVCGTGLDTVPLPGDCSIDQIAGILLDIAALSVRLNKPLTGRLMPVPGKKAGDMTEFNFAFFANGRVLDLPAAPLAGFLASEETFLLKPRLSSREGF
jgi:uncharacterized protein